MLPASFRDNENPVHREAVLVDPSLLSLQAGSGSHQSCYDIAAINQK